MREKTMFKRVIAVLLALATLIFAGCQKDKPVNDDNPSENISQNMQDDKLTVEQLPVMDNTIDLRSIKLSNDTCVTEKYEIGVPYPTSLGTVYLVREHLTEKSLTYLFVATQDNYMYELLPNIGFFSILEYGIGAYEIYTANVDNEPGEEILLMTNTGGNGGRGSWELGVYKITEKGIERMNFAEDGYKVKAEKPFKYVITNEFTDLNETVEVNKDYAYDFEEDGTPLEGADEYKYSMPWYIRPKDFDNDGINEIVIREWSSISKETTDETVDYETVYKYDAEKDEFVVSKTSVRVASENIMYDIDYNGYTYLDINGDGFDEFITHNCIDKNNVTCNVYTFSDRRMIHAGEIPCTNRSFFYYSNGILTETGSIAGKTWYKSYKLVDNKLILHEDNTIPMEEDEELFDRIGEELEWEYC